MHLRPQRARREDGASGYAQGLPTLKARVNPERTDVRRAAVASNCAGIVGVAYG
jgi:hypothetical protein